MKVSLSEPLQQEQRRQRQSDHSAKDSKPKYLNLFHGRNYTKA